MKFLGFKHFHIEIGGFSAGFYRKGVINPEEEGKVNSPDKTSSEAVRSRFGKLPNGKPCTNATNKDIICCVYRFSKKNPGKFNSTSNNCQIWANKALQSCCLRLPRLHGLHIYDPDNVADWFEIRTGKL